MEPTEVEKLQQAKQVFKTRAFNRQQLEYILGRKLTDKTWQAYETSERDDVYSIKRLFRESKQKPKKPDFAYSDIAKHAAKKAQHTTPQSTIFHFFSFEYSHLKLRVFNYHCQPVVYVVLHHTITIYLLTTS